MNNQTIAGNVGRDAETNTTPTGKQVTKWTVAVRKWADGKEATEWWKCVYWGERGAKIAQYITKGSKVTVCGETGVETYKDRDGEFRAVLTLNVRDVFLGGSGSGDSQQSSSSSSGAQPRPPAGSGQPPAQPAPATRAPASSGQDRAAPRDRAARPAADSAQQAPPKNTAPNGVEFDDDVPF